MDVREKLIEILRKPIFPHELVDPTEAVADYLLDSGVTVQEWISVKDRLPDNKEHDWVLAQVVEDNGFMHIPRVMEYRQAKMIGSKKHMAGFLSTMVYSP